MFAPLYYQNFSQIRQTYWYVFLVVFNLFAFYDFFVTFVVDEHWSGPKKGERQTERKKEAGSRRQEVGGRK